MTQELEKEPQEQDPSFNPAENLQPEEPDSPKCLKSQLDFRENDDDDALLVINFETINKQSDLSNKNDSQLELFNAMEDCKKKLYSELQNGLDKLPDSDIQNSLDKLPDSELQNGLSELPDTELQNGFDKLPDSELKNEWVKLPDSKLQNGFDKLPDSELQNGFDKLPDSELQNGFDKLPDSELQNGLDKRSDSELQNVCEGLSSAELEKQNSELISQLEDQKKVTKKH